MSLITLPIKLTKQISKLLEIRTPDSHSVLRTCLRPDPPPTLSPLVIPITLHTKTQEETLKAIYTPTDTKDESLLRGLRNCGLLTHPRVDVTVTQLQNTMRTHSHKNSDPEASVGPMNLPREVFVGSWDTVGVFFADHPVEGGGFGGGASPFPTEKGQLMDVVWGLLRDRRVNIRVEDRSTPLEIVAGGRRVGVVRVLLVGKDGTWD
ncbi:hypothetical protein HOY80DRAFT_992738 [Tuber brumale]|nr:hypothetical protein HOY80DRAFT_992738 [Tuber brumale]